MNRYNFRDIMMLRIIALIVLISTGCNSSSDHIQINVNTKNTAGKLAPFWASQIVHPTEALLTDWGKEFMDLISESGAAKQYIRIYNQPETAIRVSESGEISYDWSRFDEMAAMILASGNKLKVMFFGMPKELAVYPESLKIRPNGAEICISPPKDYQQWEALCADFMQHIIDKYGEEEINQWTFRCWNEPDLSSFWHKKDVNEYLKLYDHFAKAVKEVAPNAKIGGPALSSTSTYKDPKHYKLFLDHITSGKNHATGEVGAPIDFIGVHTYGGSGAGGGPGREFPAVDYLLEQQLRYADMRDEYPQLENIPIHVEEWGVSSGGTTGLNKKPSADVRNSQYGAAFMTTWIQRHIQMQQENDRNIENFTFCSSGYEGVRPHDFMGYRTFHTKNGFHKPILNAYKLLNKLAPNLVPVEISKPNKHLSAFATADDKRITIIMTNFQNDKINNGGPSYPIGLDIETPWEENTEVTLRHWRIDETHSNAYTAFKKIGSPQNPTVEEIAKVKSAMQLEELHKPKTMQSKDLGNINFELSCNAVSFIEILKN